MTKAPSGSFVTVDTVVDVIVDVETSGGELAGEVVAATSGAPSPRVARVMSRTKTPSPANPNIHLWRSTFLRVFRRRY